MEIADRRIPYLLVTPLTAFLLALLAVPLAIDLVYSVSRVTFETLRAPRLIGLGNFVAVIQDAGFWQALWFSLKFAVAASVAQLVLGLFLAVFLAPLLKKVPWLMALLMLPMMLAPALVGLMYRLVLHEFVGVVPYYLYLYTGDSPAFLDAANAFRTLVTIEVLQWTPFALLILYSAYAGISDDVREAAAIDGAGALKILRHIDLPLMLPTIVITFFFRFIDSFRVFDNVYVLTGSGAGGSTTTISIFIYEAFFRRNDIGFAVAASLIFLALSFLVLIGLLRLGRRHA
ncbi:sugar ABC transporter permease [Kaistia dalseonensis]|uniref:Multiple sugar transport system permease protein n=1 Tax=Kaistia dalseonensis TaxID=410840 RepID=A0ABU0H4Y4_9HYPH|nr:sugar ABC transporter permease [Kaistia dalseonensis]MCX5494792.1 sugar ABC transporter permease [Kaistia dalseonensis]MDQ0437373.1 multiple sugar transport system permease protein [Kaistia dalseonensis]